MIDIDYGTLLHYVTPALTVSLSAVGAGIGEGLASKSALEAINIQPGARGSISKTMILGSALIETASIMGLLISIILLWGTKEIPYTLYSGLATLGIAFAICIAGFLIGIVSAWPAQEACLATARQPFFAQTIFRFMLVTQSLIQTPIIFGFIVAIMIRNQIPTITTFADSMRLLSAGISIGVGCIGPGIGLAVFARTACRGLGINRNAYNKILPFTFLSEAIIETPIIFALVISIFLLFTTIHQDTIFSGTAMLAAGLCIGLGTMGAGISSGKMSAAACHQIALDPRNYTNLSRISMFGQGLIDSSAIYAFLIALLLILTITYQG